MLVSPPIAIHDSLATHHLSAAPLVADSNIAWPPLIDRFLPEQLLISNNGAYWNIEEEFIEPIYLSTLAGLSTCVGASVAFFVGTGEEDVNGIGNKSPGRRRVGPDLLAFSLALAGSVMITVCVCQ